MVVEMRIPTLLPGTVRETKQSEERMFRPLKGFRHAFTDMTS